ncbi:MULTISPECIES: helix-turn-helix domain-containing protein [unclassified Pseudomonas]|uniref:helix-turn-helix domain-containing protein n=1 Tax=unclassified Pseudomonas TaxID=196821 RepID=UPI002AB51D2F|nr:MULTISPECIES: helix-turn-helix domain-containing protein [unclassified Pseudomonas]MDY7560423.1 helix-turn-helix domain-containing protein [Pseudomonas sp. AB6]MEA9977339.1 helix-turn-helix domain-containing protein [Pseudomonas sp. RTS4]MEA9993181.1 helix-turn-helix domain-containing protein [Pseudomonas sp. AA4]MEB0039354.1 helix-turn-helix domain-containing protein [Pseudomonas sp. MH10]MEB0076009.1 helix-turn-helix domain-containing protein [Pseudomonas sp. MH10out]
MSLRNAFAAALQFLRAHQRLSQLDISKQTDPSHVSRLESAQRSVSLEKSKELAQALNLEPLSFLALVYASENRESPRSVLQRAHDDLESFGLLDSEIPAQPSKTDHPRVVESADLKQKIVKLLEEGNSQAQVARILGVAKSTVTRRLQKKEDN